MFSVCELCIWPEHSSSVYKLFGGDVSMTLILIDLCDGGGEFSCRLPSEIVPLSFF